MEDRAFKRQGDSLRLHFLISVFAVVALLGAAPAFAAEKAEDPGAPKPEFEYMELKPLILPIITDRGLTQQVSLLVSLELPYGKLQEVEPFSPRLADAYLQDLYGHLGSGGALIQGTVLDVPAIKQRLASVTVRIIGEERFHDVLLQVVQQRPM